MDNLVTTELYDGIAMFHAGTVGLRHIYDRIREFEKELGERWKPAPLLQRLAAENKTFRTMTLNIVFKSLPCAIAD